jgi:ElaB/YqjD/DUF883 family membrane-anchored ribosome-binding protein
MAYAENTATTTHTGTETSTRKRDKVRDAATSVQDNVRDTAENVRSSAANAIERGGDHAYAVHSEFDSAVRRNPTLAIVGALGLGVALGMAMNRRY